MKILQKMFTEEQMIEAIAYMYGCTVKKARKEVNTYTTEEIIRACAYLCTKGFKKTERQFKVMLRKYTERYEKLVKETEEEVEVVEVSEPEVSVEETEDVAKEIDDNIVEVVETVKVKEIMKKTKVYISVVRDKSNLKSAKFEIVKIETSSKKVAEDILFNANLAPFGNKIYTEEQFAQITGDYLQGKGFEEVDEILKNAVVYR